jgi:hypothetical protein
MQFQANEYHVYWSVWNTVRHVRRRRRIGAAIVALLLLGLTITGLLVNSSTLAMLGTTATLIVCWLLHIGILDGDLVAVCLQLFYSRPLSRIDLAIIDSQSHMRANMSDIDRSIQRAVALYRSINRGRLARVE